MHQQTERISCSVGADLAQAPRRQRPTLSERRIMMTRQANGTCPGFPAPRRLSARGALALLIVLSLNWCAARGASAAEIVPITGTVHLSIQQSGQVATITASGEYAQFPSLVVVYVQPGGDRTFGPQHCQSSSGAEYFSVLRLHRTSPTAAATAGTLIRQTLGSA